MIREIIMTKEIDMQNELSLNDLEEVQGGLIPLLGVVVAAFSAGYVVGRDMAN
jgi:lactobin A/cerein 7B family class IIb bacteriocin